jgi:hypothetical protein
MIPIEFDIPSAVSEYQVVLASEYLKKMAAY